MKKIIILLVIALFSETMIAQAHPAVVPPQSVVTAFSARFPNAQVKSWEERQEGYIADFKLNGQKLFAYYAADGSWKGTETPIKWSKNLPPAVRQAWKNSDYAAWYILHIKKIEMADGPLYVLDLNNSPLLDSDHSNPVFEEEYAIFFNEKGDLVRKDKK
jgi:Putative beta-lactamase-inhibitor-like, PepSY-like